MYYMLYLNLGKQCIYSGTSINDHLQRATMHTLYM